MSGHVYGAGTNDTIPTAWDARTVAPAPESDAALHKRVTAMVREANDAACSVRVESHNSVTFDAVALHADDGFAGHEARASTYRGALLALEAALISREK